MGDEDNTRTGLFLELLDELDDLGLDGHVQSGGGLIGNDELGVAGQGDGDDHTLTHTAGQLMRVLLESFLRRGNAYLGEQFHCLLVQLRLGHLLVVLERFHQLLFNGEHRVQEGHGVLEDHRHAVAADALHELFIGSGISVKLHRADLLSVE